MSLYVYPCLTPKYTDLTMSPCPLRSSLSPVYLGLESGWTCAALGLEWQAGFHLRQPQVTGSAFWTVVLGKPQGRQQSLSIVFLFHTFPYCPYWSWAFWATYHCSPCCPLHRPGSHSRGHSWWQPSLVRPFLLPAGPDLLVLILCQSLVKQRRDT